MPLFQLENYGSEYDFGDPKMTQSGGERKDRRRRVVPAKTCSVRRGEHGVRLERRGVSVKYGRYGQ
jgi:hypothetical protein